MNAIPSDLKALTANIGKCILVCQEIEMMLATMIIVERNQSLGALNDFISDFARRRLQMLGALRNELLELKVTYVDFDHLEQVIERRNWIVHRLFIDPRLLRILGGAADDFSDEVKFFTDAYFKIKAAYLSQTATVGAATCGVPTEEEEIRALLQLEGFASEVVARQAQIKQERKRS
jgi:hypothetical protein